MISWVYTDTNYFSTKVNHNEIERLKHIYGRIFGKNKEKIGKWNDNNSDNQNVLLNIRFQVNITIGSLLNFLRKVFKFYESLFPNISRFWWKLPSQPRKVSSLLRTYSGGGANLRGSKPLCSRWGPYFFKFFSRRKMVLTWRSGLNPLLE